MQILINRKIYFEKLRYDFIFSHARKDSIIFEIRMFLDHVIESGLSGSNRLFDTVNDNIVRRRFD